MRQRENKPKSTVFTTAGNTRNNNPFHVTSTGNVSRPQSLHKLRLSHTNKFWKFCKKY